MSDKPLSATKIGVKDKLPVMRGAFLRFPRAMREIARVSHVGCIKYDAPEGAMDYLGIDDCYGVVTDALGRHLLDEATGGPVNVEKGGHLPEVGAAVLHQAQAAWNTLARLERFLLDLEEKGISVEDLFPHEGEDGKGRPALRGLEVYADTSILPEQFKQGFEDVGEKVLEQEDMGDVDDVAFLGEKYPEG